jgi:hypothetical protein
MRAMLRRYKDVRGLAYEAACAYYKGKEHTMEQFLAFQRGFKNAYNAEYRKAIKANRV